MLTEFNNEKHEVKAKFKHLMQLVSLKANVSDDDNKSKSIDPREETLTQPAPSSYKGRKGEVDLNHCFEELEQIVLDFKEN